MNAKLMNAPVLGKGKGKASKRKPKAPKQRGRKSLVGEMIREKGELLRPGDDESVKATLRRIKQLG